MEPRNNEFGQPVGPALPGWQAPPLPPREPMVGRFCRIEPLVPGRHADELFESTGAGAGGAIWTYLPCGPFDSAASHRAWLEEMCRSGDPMPHAIVDGGTGRVTGMAAYMRMAPESGSIEVGYIIFSPLLRRQPAATEAMYLMMKRAFALGYRRYEWKCDALNAGSRAAAQRLGFSFEGIFRQATVYKGRSRDTAWYSVIDLEWPALDAAFQRWLAPDNFDENNHQHLRLSELTRPLLKARG